MFQTFFTRRVLKGKWGHSKGTWALGPSRHLGTPTLGHLKGTWTIEALKALYLADPNEARTLRRDKKLSFMKKYFN